jgi:hypothetical protein
MNTKCEKQLVGWPGLPEGRSPLHFLLSIGLAAMITLSLAQSSPAQGVWLQFQKIMASDGDESDYFGDAVAISGKRIVVGASQADGVSVTSKGAAYVFEYDSSAAQWSQTSKLTDIFGSLGDEFGRSVDIYGRYAIVGAPGDDNWEGSAHLYYHDSWWSKIYSFSGDAAGDAFGWSVAVSGADADYIAIGAPDDGAGCVTIYERNSASATWSEAAHRCGGTSGDRFGFAVALEADRLVVGAPSGNGGTGVAYVYERLTSGWAQIATLTASYGRTGDNFGQSVAICGARVIVGAINAGAGGKAYVYKQQTSGAWSEEDILEAADPSAAVVFGQNVALTAEFGVVGDPLHEVSGDDTGAGPVFERVATTWTHTQRLTARDREDGDFFGGAVDATNDWIVIGAPLEDEVGTNAGAAYIYRKYNVVAKPIGELADVFDLGSRIHGLHPRHATLAVGEVLSDASVWVPILWQDSGAGWDPLLLPDLGFGGCANAVAGLQAAELIGGVVFNAQGGARPAIWQRPTLHLTMLPLPDGAKGGACMSLGATHQNVSVVGWVRMADQIRSAALWRSDTLGNWNVVELPRLQGGGEATSHDVMPLPSGDLLVVGTGLDAFGQEQAICWRVSGAQVFMDTMPPLVDEGGSSGAHGCFRGDETSLISGYSTDATGSRHPVQWVLDEVEQEWTLVDIGLPESFTNAQVVATSGVDCLWTAVGHFEPDTGVSEAVLWPVTCLTLAPTITLNELIIGDFPWILRRATAVSQGDRIAAWGVPEDDPEGMPQAFVLELVKLPLVLPGDLNCDGTVNVLDIEPFTLALTDWSQWLDTYPDCPPENADINLDGVLNTLDIEFFVQLLTGP